MDSDYWEGYFTLLIAVCLVGLVGFIGYKAVSQYNEGVRVTSYNKASCETRGMRYLVSSNACLDPNDNTLKFFPQITTGVTQ